MIRQVNQEDIPRCAVVVRESFRTVADEFGITEENAPRFTAFATAVDRLNWHFHGEQRPMFAFWDGGEIVGYYSLLLSGKECELNNLAVLPGYRHRGIGAALMAHGFVCAKALGCEKMRIGIVEENRVLREWYEALGFLHTGTQKFDFFPFVCGYLEKSI